MYCISKSYTHTHKHVAARRVAVILKPNNTVTLWKEIIYYGSIYPELAPLLSPLLVCPGILSLCKGDIETTFGWRMESQGVLVGERGGPPGVYWPVDKR